MDFQMPLLKHLTMLLPSGDHNAFCSLVSNTKNKFDNIYMWKEWTL
jgi:hypothetical protein